MVETAADRAAFVADFGQVATYTVVGDLPVSITGILDAAFLAPAENMGTGLASREGALLVRSAELPDDASPGDAVSVAGAAYVVREIQPDGTGMTVLLLEAAG